LDNYTYAKPKESNDEPRPTIESAPLKSIARAIGHPQQPSRFAKNQPRSLGSTDTGPAFHHGAEAATTDTEVTSLSRARKNSSFESPQRPANHPFRHDYR